MNKYLRLILSVFFFIPVLVFIAREWMVVFDILPQLSSPEIGVCLTLLCPLIGLMILYPKYI